MPSKTSKSSPTPPLHRHSFSPSPLPDPPFTDSILQEMIESAEKIIKRWSYSDNSDPCTANSLFSADESREDPNQFISTVNNLQEAIRSLASTKMLVRAQQLVRLAIQRLRREFEVTLHRDYLDPSFDRLSDCDDDVVFEHGVANVKKAETVQAMNDLKSIADCMINCGYGKECAKIFNAVRRSIVDEELQRLGIDRLSLISPLHKLNWREIEDKIKNWLSAMRIAVKSIFYGERILCDLVFLSSPTTRESCFSAIAGDNALSLFRFPEQVASKCKKSPERLFRFLDLYEAISIHSSEINYIFSSESSSSVRSQVETSMLNLAEASRMMLADFETEIQKESSKTPVTGGGVHPLSSYVMNYLIFLSDYTSVLQEILSTWKLSLHAPLPEEHLGSGALISGDKKANVAVRFIWIVLLLLSNLDGKADRYNEVSLSYLFLANNLRYIVGKVRTSGLRRIVGDDWAAKHDEKVRQYAASYERIGWSKVIDPLLNDSSSDWSVDDSIERAKERFRRFNGEFVEVQRKHIEWVVVDPKLREDIKDSLARNIVPKYRELYDMYRDKLARGKGGTESVVKYAPEDLENYLWGLLFGCSDGDSSLRSRASTTSSCSSSPSSLW